MQATDLAKARRNRRGRARDDLEGLAPATPAELARDLARFTQLVFRESGQDYYSLVGELELTITQIKTLHWLDCHDRELSLKELSEALGLSLPTTSRNVEALLQRGLLERREDERDRRVRLVRIAASGREISTRLEEARLAGMERVAASLSELERRRLRTALAPLVARAAAPRPVGGAPTDPEPAA